MLDESRVSLKIFLFEGLDETAAAMRVEWKRRIDSQL